MFFFSIKDEHFDAARDFDLIIKNLKNCLESISQLASLAVDPSIKNASEDDESQLDSIDFYQHLNRIKRIFQSFKLDEDNFINKKLNDELVSEFAIEKNEFEAIINQYVVDLASPNDETQQKFVFFAKILLKNQNYLFEKDASLFKEFDLDANLIGNLELLSKCVFVLLSFISHSDSGKAFHDENDLKPGLIELLIKSHEYKPLLFQLLVKIVSNEKEKFAKHVKKFSPGTDKLVALIDSCLANEEEIEQDTLGAVETKYVNLNTMSQKLEKKINAKSVESLLTMYTHTMSKKDLSILKRLYKLDPKLDCLIFKLKNIDDSDAMSQQAKIVDFIGAKVNETFMTNSIQNFPIERKLDELGSPRDVDLNKPFELESIILSNNVPDANIYDPVYMLPNMYCLLDYGKTISLLNLIQNIFPISDQDYGYD